MRSKKIMFVCFGLSVLPAQAMLCRIYQPGKVVGRSWDNYAYQASHAVAARYAMPDWHQKFQNAVMFNHPVIVNRMLEEVEPDDAKELVSSGWSPQGTFYEITFYENKKEIRDSLFPFMHLKVLKACFDRRVDKLRQYNEACQKDAGFSTIYRLHIPDESAKNIVLDLQERFAETEHKSDFTIPQDLKILLSKE